MMRETDFLVFLIMCSLQRESIFALAIWLASLQKSVFLAKEDWRYYGTHLLGHCCHWEHVTEQNTHFCQRELYYAISFVKQARSIQSLSHVKPFAATRMSSKNTVLITLSNRYVSFHDQFMSICSCANRVPCVHSSLSDKLLNYKCVLSCLWFLHWVSLVLPLHLIRT